MGHRVRLIIPDHREAAITPIIGKVIGRWGGCTIGLAYGWWSEKDGKPVRDKLSVLECSIGEWTPQVRIWWVDLANVVRKSWDQDCVFLSVVGETAMLISDATEEIIGA